MQRILTFWLILALSHMAQATPQEDRVRQIFTESIAARGDNVEFMKKHPDYFLATLTATVVEASEAFKQKKPMFLTVDPLTLSQSRATEVKSVQQTDPLHVAVEFAQEGPRGVTTQKCIFLLTPDLKVEDILFPDRSKQGVPDTLRTLAESVNRANKDKH